MVAAPSPAPAPACARARCGTQHETKALRNYYLENDIFLSTEGILKVMSIIVCIVSSVLFLGGGSCSGAPGLVTSAAAVELAVAAAMALLYAAVALQLPLLAPQTFLYTDIIVSSAAGVLVLVTGALSFSVCELRAALDYAHGPLAMTIAALVMLSAGITYSAAMRHWDAAAGPAQEPRPPSIHEHDV